jgi:hypothetical protein
MSSYQLRAIDGEGVQSIAQSSNDAEVANRHPAQLPVISGVRLPTQLGTQRAI